MVPDAASKRAGKRFILRAREEGWQTWEYLWPSPADRVCRSIATLRGIVRPGARSTICRPVAQRLGVSCPQEAALHDTVAAIASQDDYRRSSHQCSIHPRQACTSTEPILNQNTGNRKPQMRVRAHYHSNNHRHKRSTRTRGADATRPQMAPLMVIRARVEPVACKPVR